MPFSGMLLKANRLLARLEWALLIVLVLLMVGLSGLQIVLRKIFNAGLLWGDILLRNLVLWVSFLGASLATIENRHIRIDLLTRFVPARWQWLPRLITYLFALLVTLLLTHASLKFVLDERAFASTLFNRVPAWPFQVIIPLGFALMALRFALLTLLTILERGEGKQ